MRKGEREKELARERERERGRERERERNIQEKMTRGREGQSPFWCEFRGIWTVKMHRRERERRVLLAPYMARRTHQLFPSQILMHLALPRCL